MAHNDLAHTLRRHICEDQHSRICRNGVLEHCKVDLSLSIPLVTLYLQLDARWTCKQILVAAVGSIVIVLLLQKICIVFGA